MSEKETVVKVMFDDDKKLVIETPEGKEETYYLDPIRSICLHVENLQVDNIAKCTADFETKTLEPLPGLSLRIRGTAEIINKSFFNECTISVLGERGNKTRTLNICFWPLHADPPKQDEEKNTPPYGKTFVGLNRPNEWFIECYVSIDTLIAISSAVSSGTFGKMTVCLKLQEIYTDADPYAPLMEDTNWFLRPNRRDNSIESPGIVSGGITSLIFTLVPINISMPETASSPQTDTLCAVFTEKDIDKLNEIDSALVLIKTDFKYILEEMKTSLFSIDKNLQDIAFEIKLIQWILFFFIGWKFMPLLDSLFHRLISSFGF